MDYGIATRNKFELFIDDEDVDPLEILRLTEEENLKKKTEVVKGKDSKSQKDSKSAKNKKNNKAQTSVQDQKSKAVESKDAKKDDKPLRNKPRNDDRTNRPPRENRERDLPPRRQQQQDGRPMNSGFGQQTSPSGGDQFRERGEGRGRGRGRGGRGGGRGRGGFDRFGKREFERHSGSDKTGIKATDKREGGGAHNWGTVKDDVDDQQNTTAPAEGNEWAAQSEDTENVQPDSAPDATDEAVPEEDQAPIEMTLDEYKALRNKEKQGSAFNVRKPGEGCDGKQWQKTYVLKKKVEEEEEESEEEEDDDEMDHRKKNLVPIEITFGDSRRGGGRGRGGRGGRGGGMDRGGGRGGGMDRMERGGGRGGGMDRGRGGRGGRGSGSGPNTGRGGRREQAPNVEDELDFPSLVSKPAA